MCAPCPAVGGEATLKVTRAGRGFPPGESGGRRDRAEDPAFKERAAPGEQSWDGACAETGDAWVWAQ